MVDRDQVQQCPSGLVPPEWHDQGERFLGAWVVYGPPDAVERALRVVAATGTNPLSPARRRFESAWATCSRTGTSPPKEEAPEWHEYLAERGLAERAVGARLVSGALIAFGSPRYRDGDPAWIPPQAWAGLRLDRDLPNVVRGPGLVYFNVRVIEAKEWFDAEHVAPNPGSAQAKQKKRPSPARRDFTAADRPLTKEMHRMLTAKPPKAKDKQEAASYVVDRAAGDGTVFSKIKRLMKHYSDVYG